MLYKVLLTFVMIIGFSRPISYPKSWTFIQKTNDISSNFILHYSFNVNNSLGFVYKKLHKGIYNDALGFRWNYLFYRKNTKTSQWNTYLLNSLTVDTDSDFSSFIHEVSLQTDWESRRYLVAFKVSYKSIENKEDFYKYSSRLGIAPYIGKYNDFHTWLMLETSYENNNEKLVITPILRFFKYIYLFELGVDSNGKGVFNFIIRF